MTTLEALRFGKPENMGIGPSFHVLFYKDCLLVIQAGTYPRLNPEHNGRLLVYQNGKRIGCLNDIGSARQIAVQGDVAYITSREDGLFIADLSNPASPRLLCHYETAEYATGVAVSGDLLAVSLRQYGLEFIDVRDPGNPRFISLARTGEAQSLCLDGHYAYAGVWGSQELVIVDIQTLREPRVVCRAPLDGRGDGVAVRDGVCFAATGHHARKPGGAVDPSLWQNRGNGLEIFDVKNPEAPVRLSGIKFPPYYGLTFDMWQVKVSGDIALVGNTRNGLFAVDIRDLRNPRLLDRVQLPPMPCGTPDPITGFDYEGDRLALSGGEGDCYRLTLSRPLAPAHRSFSSVRPMGESCERRIETLYGPDLHWRWALEGHDVKCVADGGNRLFAACSGEGVYELDRETLAARKIVASAGFVNALVYRPPYLYVAEGAPGVGTYREENGVFTLVSALEYRGRALSDLALSGDGRFMLAQCASLGVLMLSLDDPARPMLIGEKLDFIGLFYGRHFPSRGVRGECFLGSNRDGCMRLRAGEEGLEFENFPLAEPFGYGPASGLEIVGDQLFVVSGGGYLLLPLSEPVKTPAERRAIPGERLAGKPRLGGKLMVVTERAEGQIALVNMETPEAPRVFGRARTTASPDLAFMDGEHIYIPGGRLGLLVGNMPSEEDMQC